MRYFGVSFALILTPSPHPSPGVCGVCELSGKLTDCKQLEMLPLFSPSTYQENSMNYRWKDVFKVSVSEWFFWVYFTSSYFAYLYFQGYVAYSKIHINFKSFKKPLKNHFFSACSHEVLLIMVLSQHQNFYLWYLVDRKKNKDFHPSTHLFAEIYLNPLNAEGFTMFELDKGYDQWP